jgi:hypothetical protein
VDISPRLIWPLVGILLGWVLSALSGGWKERSTRLRLFGKLLSRLVDVHSDLRAVIRSSEPLKDASNSAEQYEAIRQRLLTRHFLSSEGRVDDLPDLVSRFAEYRPIEASQLQTLVSLLHKSKSVSLTATAQDRSRYLLLLSMHEVGLDVYERELSKTIRNLALRHGISTIVKLWLHRRQIDRSIVANMPNIEQFMARTKPGAE